MHKFLQHHQKLVRFLEISAILGVILFSYFLFTKHVDINKIIKAVQAKGTLGKLIYLSYVSVSVVISPLTASPLWPMAILAYGYWTTLLITVSGDLIGGSINFLIAKRYGREIVEKIFGKRRAQHIDNMIDAKHWKSFFVFRFLSNFTYDYVSYACGLTKMNFKTYFAITFFSKITWTSITFLAINKSLTSISSPTTITIVLGYLGLLILTKYFWRRRVGVAPLVTHSS